VVQIRMRATCQESTKRDSYLPKEFRWLLNFIDSLVDALQALLKHCLSVVQPPIIEVRTDFFGKEVQ